MKTQKNKLKKIIILSVFLTFLLNVNTTYAFNPITGISNWFNNLIVGSSNTTATAGQAASVVSPVTTTEPRTITPSSPVVYVTPRPLSPERSDGGQAKPTSTNLQTLQL